MATTKQLRAAKGGEIGMNGEPYAAGTFLPNTTLTKMAKRTPGTGSRKQIIAPCEWAVAPSKNLTSLFAQFREFVNLNTGTVNEDGCRYYHKNPREIAFLFDLWKSGERWVLA